MPDIELNQADHAVALAEALDESTEEVTLSVTDASLAAVALRHYAAWIDSQT